MGWATAPPGSAQHAQQSKLNTKGVLVKGPGLDLQHARVAGGRA